MIQTADQYLDADELMHLALTAAREGKNEDAIVYFKRALHAAPDEPGLHYLLGVQYLRIGLTQRAVAHIERALALNPALDGARFQLGWLYWAHGNVDTAAETWKPLDQHGTEHPLYLFKTGLLHLAKNEYSECEDCLRRGIEANQTDTALNYDMAQILKRIQGRAASAATAANDAPGRTETPRKPAATPRAATAPTETKPATATKTESSAKPDAAAPKPKLPKNVVLSVYQQNKPDDAENQ